MLRLRPYTRNALVGSVVLVPGSLPSVLLYLRTFMQALVPLGPDLFGYIWADGSFVGAGMSLYGCPGLEEVAARREDAEITGVGCRWDHALRVGRELNAKSFVHDDRARGA